MWSSRSVRCIGDGIAVHDPLPRSIVNLRLIVIETQAVVAGLLGIFRPVFIRISRAYKDDVAGFEIGDPQALPHHRILQVFGGVKKAGWRKV